MSRPLPRHQPHRPRHDQVDHRHDLVQRRHRRRIGRDRHADDAQVRDARLLEQGPHHLVPPAGRDRHDRGGVGRRGHARGDEGRRCTRSRIRRTSSRRRTSCRTAPDAAQGRSSTSSSPRSTPATVSLSVLNGTLKTGEAATDRAAAGEVRLHDVVRQRARPSPTAQTWVYYAAGHARAAADVAHIVGARRPHGADAGLDRVGRGRRRGDRERLPRQARGRRRPRSTHTSRASRPTSRPTARPT